MTSYLRTTFVILAATFAISGNALADPGGVPNTNAFIFPGQGEPQGRIGRGCIVPGTFIRGLAMEEGSTIDAWGELGYDEFSPGQNLATYCTPADPS